MTQTVSRSFGVPTQGAESADRYTLTCVAQTDTRDAPSHLFDSEVVLWPDFYQPDFGDQEWCPQLVP